MLQGGEVELKFTGLRPFQRRWDVYPDALSDLIWAGGGHLPLGKHGEKKTGIEGVIQCP
jgi:hypothetical protein